METEIVEKRPLLTHKNGYNYFLVKETEKAKIVEQVFRESGISGGYEVFKRKTVKDRMVFGAFQPEHEYFPSNEDFGKSAWTANTLDRAEQILSEIENRIR